jgi:GxxExxY protein
MVTQEQEHIAKQIIDCAFTVHSALGPGLLENAYQKCLVYELQRAGLVVEEEKPIPLIYKGVHLDCGYRIDILVEKKVIIENKAVSDLTDIHLAQILSYMKLSGVSLGFLFNFNVRSFKNGIKRVVL